MNPVTMPREWALPSLAAPDRSNRCNDNAEETGASEGPTWWLQRRCSLSPTQLGGCFLALAALSAVVALFFWAQGARFVAYFAGAEVLLLGLAFVCHAMHATDGERLRVEGGRLLVERRDGLRHGHEAIELSGLRVGEAADGAIELRVGRRCVRIGRHADAARRQQVLADLRRLALRPAADSSVRT